MPSFRHEIMRLQESYWVSTPFRCRIISLEGMETIVTMADLATPDA